MNATGTIKPPIFIKEGGDLSIFETIDDAVRYIEPIDVLAGVYVGYDSQGMLLNLKAQSHRYHQPIEVASAETEPTHQDELRDVLITYLRVLGLSESSLAQASLEALVIEAMPLKETLALKWPPWGWLRWLTRK